MKEKCFRANDVGLSLMFCDAESDMWNDGRVSGWVEKRREGFAVDKGPLRGKLLSTNG